MVVPKQKEHFEKFYKLIQSKKYTTAMLQEFLFFNRKSDNVIDKIDEFYDIINKNDPKKYEKIENLFN